MNIRQGTIEEFQKLWNYTETTTYRYFLGNLTAGNIEFWTVELEEQLIGELYIFWDSPDKDEADGVNRAYLCAFRIKREHQNKGYGKLLFQAVLNRIEEKGFKEVSIGIDTREYEKLSNFYKDFGFNELIKQKKIDLHYLNRRGKPQEYAEPYNLVLRK